MPRVFLIHWKDDEIREREERLWSVGYEVDHDAPDYRQFRKLLKSDPPSAVVIDLGRLPSHGREIATWLRDTKATRSIPLVFVDGEDSKVERTRELFPDAAYTTWPHIGRSVRRAIAHPPTNPAALGSMSGYSGTPLPKKPGIKPGFVVALVNAPMRFESTLGALPDAVTLRHSGRGRNDLMIWFPKSQSDYEKRIMNVARQFGGGGLWVAWPKKASGIKSDLSSDSVRRIGLASGLVNYKVCAIDEIYSGLKFTNRKNRS